MDEQELELHFKKTNLHVLKLNRYYNNFVKRTKPVSLGCKRLIYSFKCLLLVCPNLYCHLLQ